jgi:hypothetical protein
MAFRVQGKKELRFTLLGMRDTVSEGENEFILLIFNRAPQTSNRGPFPFDL